MVRRPRQAVPRQQARGVVVPAVGSSSRSLKRTSGPSARDRGEVPANPFAPLPRRGQRRLGNRDEVRPGLRGGRAPARSGRRRRRERPPSVERISSVMLGCSSATESGSPSAGTGRARRTAPKTPRTATSMRGRHRRPKTTRGDRPGEQRRNRRDGQAESVDPPDRRRLQPQRAPGRARGPSGSRESPCTRRIGRAPSPPRAPGRRRDARRFRAGAAATVPQATSAGHSARMAARIPRQTMPMTPLWPPYCVTTYVIHRIERHQ